MSDKFPFFAAESGTWKTTSPNPHIDLSGTALTLGTYPAQTFKQAADDTTLDFASTNTCTVVVWVDATNWKRYEGAVWTDATPDTLDLSAATLMGAAGTISADAAVSVVASLQAQPAASQAEMETGTEAAIRSMSPLRVAQSRVSGFVAVGSGASTTQSIPASTWTKISSVLDTETSDASGLWDHTNKKLIPTKAGKYFIVVDFQYNAGAAVNHQAAVYKNGSVAAYGTTSFGSYSNAAATAIVEANGSTDYFEFYTFHTNSGAITNYPGTNNVTFTAVFIGN